MIFNRIKNINLLIKGSFKVAKEQGMRVGENVQVLGGGKFWK